MSLGHVYIVLEPVGAARLTFNDDRHYEFTCFDVPKLVRNPRCDHVHDEESQNGRDINIDILDDYIRTSDEFRGSPDIYQSAGRVIGTIGEVMGLIGPRGERGAAKGWPRAPPPLGVRIGQKGAAPPLSSLSPSPSFPLSYSY